MVDLASFTSIEVQPVIFCRASRVWSKAAQQGMTWRQVGYEDLFDWPPELPVQRYAKAWDRAITARGGLTYTRFRERVRQIAVEVLSLVEGVVVVHDFQTLLAVVERLGRCVVVPVDDDDWIAPDLGRVLAGVRFGGRTRMLVWPDVAWWCDYDGDGRPVGRFSVQADDQLAVAVGSNSYALTHHAFREWPAEWLKTALCEHWKVQVPNDQTEIVNEQLSLEVKHVASTSVLLVEKGKTYWWTRDTPGYEPPLWAKEHCDKIRELHAQLKTDMGGTFNRHRLIRETEA